MKNIVICEDSPRQLDHLKDCIEKYIFIEDLDLKIVLTASGPEPVQEYLNMETKGNTLYFLDIDLGEGKLTGIDLAKAIRQKDDLSKIVFITTLDGAMPQVFKNKLEALDFIVKDDFDKIAPQVRQCIDTALERTAINATDKKIFTAKIGRRTKLIDYDDIYYFQASDNHKIILIGNNEYFEFYDNLSTVIEQTQFLQVHRSYVVNLSQVVEYDNTNKELHFPEELVVPVGRKYHKDLLEALAKLEK